MKRRNRHLWLHSALCLLLLTAAACASLKKSSSATTASAAEKLPDDAKILETMRVANNYFMQKWPDTGKNIVTNISRQSNIWTRAVYYEGLMALYRVDPQQRYYDYAVDWGNSHKWGLRDGNSRTRNADNQCAGQTYIELYKIDPQPERIREIKTCMDYMLESPRVNDWTWIDALQMAMPVFAHLGAIYQDDRYYEKMYEMYMESKTKIGGGLYNPAHGLWWRDKDFVPPTKSPDGKDIYWSRGNGWVVAALVRVMDIMPKDAPHREEYLKTYLEMMEALVPLQREDGYWNVSLHDPNHFGGKELTGTSLFIYGMAWGINNGLLDEKKYKPVIAKAWNAMATEAVHTDGFLGYVQGTGKEPKDGQPVTYTSKPDFEDYGLGCFLLAGTEIMKMK